MKKCTLALAALLTFCSAFANTFIVTSNADSGPGTLREAITMANANGTATPDLISFNLAFTDTASITIDLLTALPDLTANVTIDGTTQPSAKLGVSDSKIIIEPQGENNYIIMLDHCLRVNNADDVKIYGLCFRYISEFVVDGSVYTPQVILLNNANNFVFGGPGRGNVISSCSYGIFKAYFSGTADNSIIQSNFIGVDIDGFTQLRPDVDFENDIGGVELTQVNNATIGGNTAAEGNVFGNVAAGLSFIEVTGTINVGFNKFGTDYTGNKELIRGTAFGGRDSPASFFLHDNIVSGESDFSEMSGRFLVVRNFFGANSTQTSNFANGILDFNNCTGEALIGGNDASTMNVFGNGVLGVGNDNSTKITVLHNSFYCHENGGIYMGWYTLPGKPFITINKLNATSIEGTSRPGAIIELYNTDTCRLCEGKVFIGRLNADATGKWKYNSSITGSITATSTNIDDSTTSDFAVPQADFSNATIKNATCNKANGSITGIKITSGTIFQWIDDNGTVVGLDSNLVNVKSGNYQLVIGIGNNFCRLSSQTFTIENTVPPLIDATAFVITQPSCGLFNGSVSYVNNVSPPDSAYWINAQGNIIERGTVLQNAAQGSYYFRIATQGDTSCSSSVGPLVLTNQSGPNLITANINITPSTCGNSNGSITGITASNVAGTASIKWYDSLNNVVGTAYDLINVLPGKYRFNFKDASGCDTIKTPYYIVTDNGNITVDTTGVLITGSKCSSATGSIQHIQVTGATNYQWINTGTQAVAGGSPDLTNVLPGTYQLNVTNSYGCTSSSPVFFIPSTIFNSLSVTSATVSNALCSQNTGAVTINSFSKDSTLYTFRWINDSTGQTISTATSLSGLPAGKYVLYAKDSSGCEQNIFVASIVSVPPPVINYTASVVTDDQCRLMQGAVTLSVSGLSGPTAYTWYDENDHIAGTGSNLQNVLAGAYTVTITDGVACTIHSDPFLVGNNNVALPAPVYSDVIIPRNTDANINLSGPADGVYFLYYSAGATSPVLQNNNGDFLLKNVGQDTTVYIQQVSGFCSSTIVAIHIKVVDHSYFAIPNAFTPNGDGVNDVLHVRVIGPLELIDFRIFNQWGQLVFETHKPGDGWDGTFKGAPQNTAFFVWIADGKDINGKVVKNKGSFILIR